MNDCSQSHLSESPGVQLSNMLCFPVTYKWANTKDQRWTYKELVVVVVVVVILFPTEYKQ